MLDLLKFIGITEAAYIPSAIEGVFSFAALLLTGLAAIVAWLSKQWLMKREKRNDLRYALWAELEAQWRMLYFVPRSDDLLTKIREKMEAPGGDNYAPYFSSFLEAEIYNEVKSQITALGREEISYIVRFQHQLLLLRSFVIELRATEFKTFPNERKLQMISHFFRMIDKATELAEAALQILERQNGVDYTKRLAAIRKELDALAQPTPTA